MGQGASNACNCWVIGTDDMANAYTKKAHGWIIPTPSTQNPIRQDLQAFINDVNLFIGKPDNTTDKPRDPSFSDCNAEGHKPNLFALNQGVRLLTNLGKGLLRMINNAI